MTPLNYKEKKNKDARVRKVTFIYPNGREQQIPVFIKTSKLRDSNLDRKFNVDYVTESVGKADDNLGTNLRVKGP